MAPLYIIFNALIAALLVWAPYTILVEFSMLLSVPSILLFMWSFVALRVQQPKVNRPFRIPGGIATAVLITVVPVAISISYAAIVTTESLVGRRPARVDKEPAVPVDDEKEEPAYQIYSMLAVMIFGLIIHAIGSRWVMAFPQIFLDCTRAPTELSWLRCSKGYVDASCKRGRFGFGDSHLNRCRPRFSPVINIALSISHHSLSCVTGLP